MMANSSVAQGPEGAPVLWLGFEAPALAGASLEGLAPSAGPGLGIRLKPGQARGTLETAPLPAPGFDTAIVSWNAETPAGSWLELFLRAQLDSHWTPYYPLAVWSSDPQKRHSFEASGDPEGQIQTDTLVLRYPASALQIRVVLHSTAAGVSPSLTGLAAVMSRSSTHFNPNPSPSDSKAWGLELAVPPLSQMRYQGGGEVWCSPTSVSMLLGYWSAKLGQKLDDPVPLAAQATWDRVYGGAGNWPFNTAYAGLKGLRAYIHRLSGLAEAEAYLERGIPLALSIAWGKGELPGAPLEQSSGHLVVLRGFTQEGHPILNDPAAPEEAGVRTIYPRQALERAWIAHSGGVVYVLEPHGAAL
ncbi:MAG: peptidase C39 family protein [Thermaceae bacterium]|nr:peptidase C39 family protein [Thermaceae bacterium]